MPSLAAFLATAASLAFASASSSLLTLSSSNVDTTLLRSKVPSLVAFTAKWCGHCTAAKPRLMAASADPFVQSRAQIAIVDCEEDKPICQAFDVQGYPSIFFLPANTGSLPDAKAKGSRFVGPRTTAGFRDFLLRMTRPEPLLFLRPASHPQAYSPQSFEGEYSAIESPNFSVERMIGGLGRDGVSFLFVIPSSSSSSSGDATGDDDDLLASSVKSAIDYSSSKAAKATGAHPFVIATLAAAETLKSEVTVIAATADVVKKNSALKEALKPLLEAKGDAAPAAVANLKEPVLLQIQTAEKRIEVARVVCESNDKSKSKDKSSYSSPLLGVEAIAAVPCDPATGTPLSSTSKADELASTVARWIKTQRFPAVSELTPDSYPYLANNEGTYLAIAVVNETQINEHNKKASNKQQQPGKPVLMPPKSALFLTSFQKLASRSSTTLSPAVRNKFLFGWLDGEVHHEHFLSQFNVSPSQNPTLLVIDIPTKRYWLLDETVAVDASGSYEAMESQLEDIVSGKAPVFRQGMLAVPQKLVNRIGLIPSVAVGVVTVGAIGWLIWKLVLSELCGFNDGTKTGGYGSSVALDAETAAEEAYKARQAAKPAQYRGASPSRNAKAAAPPKKNSKGSDDEDDNDDGDDVDDDGNAFERVAQHDDVDEDEDSEEEERKKKASSLRQRKGNNEEEEEENMSASARAAAKRRQNSRRRVDE